MIKKEQKPTKKQNIEKKKEIIRHDSIMMELGFLPKSIPKKTVQKIKSGRPSKYSNELCMQIMQLLAEGKSKLCAITEMGISEPTFYSWVTEYFEEIDEKTGKTYKKLNTNYKPNFLKCVKAGEQLYQRWWEENGRINLHNKDFNSTLWMMNMQNRFGWSRKLEGKIDVNETYKEIKEVVFKFETKEIKSYIGELVELGVIETPTKIH